MKQLKNVKKSMALIMVICMFLSISMPIISYADDVWEIESNGTMIGLSVEPYKNELGFMINAEDALKAYGYAYQFYPEDKALVIETETKEKVVLMHNATIFKSGDETYDCKPYFYVENGVPMIELGFLCNMFYGSYENSGKHITINKEKLSDNVAKITIDGEETPLYIEPYETELGLVVGLKDMAKAFGIDYSFDEDNNSVTLTDEKHGCVILNDKARTFKSGNSEFECAPNYFVSDGIAFIQVQFFCEMYGATYSYDEQTKVIHIKKDAQENYVEEEILPKEYAVSPKAVANLTGKVSYTAGAPTNGINVKLILQQTTTRNVLYQGQVTYAGQTYVLGTVRLNEGETYKNYSFDVSQYYSSNYPTYTLFYEESDLKEYGYYNSSNSITRLDSSPLYTNEIYSSAKKFSSNTSASANIKLDNYSAVYGAISLEDDSRAPENIKVDLILQTRGATYTRKNLYGGYKTSYNIGETKKLGTVSLNKDALQSKYNYIVSQHYTNDNYPYYTLFYSAEDSECVEPYGYYDSSGQMQTIDISPYDSEYILLDSMVLNLMNNFEADINLPVNADYSPPNFVTGVKLNKSSLSLIKGNVEKLAATVVPSNAANKNVSWKSSNTGVATVANGVITAVSAGTAIITVKTADGGYTASCTVTVTEKAVEANAPKITISDIKTMPGKEIQVNVDLSNNTGFVDLGIEVGYNSEVMTLTGIKANSGVGAAFTPAQSYTVNPYNFGWSGTKNITYNGNLATLTFTVKENAADGIYPITVDYYKGRNGNYTDGDDVNYDENGNAVGFAYINGNVTVANYIPGDVNGDGKVNNKDATHLLRYLAGWNLSDVIDYALDADGSGSVNNKDATHILRYLAGWDITLH